MDLFPPVDYIGMCMGNCIKKHTTLEVTTKHSPAIYFQIPIKKKIKNKTYSRPPSNIIGNYDYRFHGIINWWTHRDSIVPLFIDCLIVLFCQVLKSPKSNPIVNFFFFLSFNLFFCTDSQSVNLFQPLSSTKNYLFYLSQPGHQV